MSTSGLPCGGFALAHCGIKAKCGRSSALCAANTKRRENYMETKRQEKVMAERLHAGRYFRVMLREVKPEHVADMIQMLWLFAHSGKQLKVPKEGRWLMKMPHGYGLVGEGPVGFRIEPPPSQAALSANNPDSGDHCEKSLPTVPVQNLDEHDTQGVIALCERARQTVRPERDQIISQIFALNLDRCRPKALDAIELLLYDLITNDTA